MERISGRFHYDKPADAVLKEFGPGKTQQQFAKDADIHNIIAKYQRTGVLGDGVGTRQAMFGDFSNGNDLMTVQNKILAINNSFNKLPADLRSKFQNNPSIMLDWLVDPANKAEAIKIGLLKDDYVPPATSPAGNVNDQKVPAGEQAKTA